VGCAGHAGGRTGHAGYAKHEGHAQDSFGKESVIKWEQGVCADECTSIEYGAEENTFSWKGSTCAGEFASVEEGAESKVFQREKSAYAGECASDVSAEPFGPTNTASTWDDASPLQSAVIAPRIGPRVEQTGIEANSRPNHTANDSSHVGPDGGDPSPNVDADDCSDEFPDNAANACPHH
jgi:hypothetical protein